MSSGASHLVDQVGVFRPKRDTMATLGPGEIGYFTAAIKEVADTRVGDTVTEERRPCEQALAGFKPSQPVVFCGLFPTDSSEFEDLRDAMAKLRLNDASFEFEMETSAIYGLCNILGHQCLSINVIVANRVKKEYSKDMGQAVNNMIQKSLAIIEKI